MQKNLINFKTELTIDSKASIQEALKVIESGEERICFLIDNKKRLLASISDGDIRRALLKGYSLKSKVIKIQNRRPVFSYEDASYEEAVNKFSNRIRVIPIINRNGIYLGHINKNKILPFLNIKSRKVLVLGLGYVGLTLAMVMSESGYTVKGFDLNKNLIKKLKSKIPPFYEKGMQDYLDLHVGHNFKPVDNIKNEKADIYIISIGTPFDRKKNKPDLTAIFKSIQQISLNLKKNDLIILRSTVPIGTSKILAKIIEKNTKLIVGKDIFLAFCPERTVEGKALLELKRLPQIIGGVCKRSSEMAQRLFSEYTYTVIDVGSLEAAEFCKLIDNTYRDTIFGYSNQLSILSEELNLDLNDIIEKVNLGYDRNKVPKPSPGVGGPCLSKDPYILLHGFKSKHKKNNLILNARKVNEMMIENMCFKTEKILNTFKKRLANSKIFISGFAFKGNPETSDYRNSTTLDLLKKLKTMGAKKIFGHDFVVSESEFQESINIKFSNLNEGFKEADVVFIMNNHNKYKDLNILKLIKNMSKPGIFFDAWQIFPPSEIKRIDRVYYTSIGRS